MCQFLFACFFSKLCFCYLFTAVAQAPQPPEIEYDFVEEPSRDCYCPVTFELLRDPHQTTCCGHHISATAGAKLQQEGKPCPMCKEPSFTTHADKYFKRVVNGLKVRCPHKGSGCEWEDDLGSLDQHTMGCPKRPWQCQYCDTTATYDVGANEHLPQCLKFPKPCPNRCEVGTVERCNLEKHLASECSLQLVTCEFSHTGCTEKVPRKDLARHMEDGMQKHQLSMSLLNLSLTRELHQKMDEKDRQIAELQLQLQQLDRKVEQLDGKMEQLDGKVTGQFQQLDGNVKQLDRKIREQFQQLDGKVWEQFQQLDRKVEQLDGKMEQIDGKVTGQFQQLDGNVKQLDRKIREQFQQLDGKVEEHFQYLAGLVFTNKFTFTQFSQWKAGKKGSYYSEPFYSGRLAYKFKFNIDFDDTKMRVYLYLLKGDHDDLLYWPIKCVTRIKILNQVADHDHIEGSNSWEWRKTTGETYKKISDIGYSSLSTQTHLKGDSLRCELYITVSTKLL